MAGLLTSIRSFFTRKENSAIQGREPVTATAATSTTAAKLPQVVSDDDFYQQLLPKTNKSCSLSLPQKLIIQVVEEHLFNKDSRHQAIPRLPAIIPQLIRSLKDSKSSSRDYSVIIRKDPSMSAGVLKLANSAYFNPSSSPISSIDTAVVKLGIEGLRSVLSAVVMHPVIQQQTPPVFNIEVHNLNG